MKTMKTMKTIFSMTLIAIPLTNAIAANECGPDGPGGGTISVCSAISSPFNTGITYTNSDGHRVRLNAPGIVVGEGPSGGVALESDAISNNPVSVEAYNFNTITTTNSSRPGIFVRANGTANASIDMRAGTISTTGTFSPGLDSEVTGNSIATSLAKTTMSGGSVSATQSTAVLAGVYNNGLGSAEVALSGGTVTGGSGGDAVLAGVYSSLSTGSATINMTGGTATATGAFSTGLQSIHRGTGSMVVNMSGGTTSGEYAGIQTGEAVVDNSTHVINVSGGATVSTTGASGFAIFSDSDFGGGNVTINITGSTTLIDGSTGSFGILDGGADASITSSGRILGGVRTNAGDDTLLLQNGSTTTGTFDMGAGQDAITISATADITGVTSMDGGADATDVLTFSGVARNDTFAGSALPNWERIILDQAALNLSSDLTVGIIRVNNNGSLVLNSPTTTITGGVDVNTGGRLSLSGAGTTAYSVTGAMTNDGLITLQDGVAGDSLSLGSTYGFAGDTAGIIRLDVLDVATRDNIAIAGPIAGSTALEINNLGLPLVPGTIIPLITTGGGPGVFTLAGGPIVLAGVTYNLERSGNNWNLVGAANGLGAQNTPIPTLSTWGIFLLSGLLALFGLRRIRKI